MKISKNGNIYFLHINPSFSHQQPHSLVKSTSKHTFKLWITWIQSSVYVFHFVCMKSIEEEKYYCF